MVISPNWTNGAAANAGAVTWASGTAGVSGIVSTMNSAVGSVANSGLGTLVLDNVNGTFFVPFVTDGGGQVRVGAGHGHRGRPDADLDADLGADLDPDPDPDTSESACNSRCVFQERPDLVHRQLQRATELELGEQFRPVPGLRGRDEDREEA